VISSFALFYVNAFPVSFSALAPKNSDTIKWVDFDVTYAALKDAMVSDIESYKQDTHISWIDALSYLGAKYGGNFKNYKEKDLINFCDRLKNGESLESITNGMKYFSYYQRAYGAVLNGFLGEYKLQVPTGEDGSVIWQEKYGLKAFSPIAKGYWYTDSDDFGVGRSYGYSRKHFGHDLMVSTGAPVIAIESGTVEVMGWNQYGGWRIGIRSFDKTRYYYYAHLRKDHPYNNQLYVGKAVTAGDVIGYSGRTGYSIKENVNNIDTPHLHVGMQLIFDEAEKDSPNQIWIDLYAITRLLSANRSEVYKDEVKKEYYRSYLLTEPNYYQQERAASLTMASEESVPVPIIMYHGLIKDRKLQTQYFISPEKFKQDLEYIKKNGYTTIVMNDLIDYVENGTPLPAKPIILTFDDGYYNNYLYGYPLLKEYGMKAVFSIIGRYTDQYSLETTFHAPYSHLTWNQINEMIVTGHAEIQNHTYNMHSNKNGRDGSKQKPGESVETYTITLNEDLGKLQNRIYEMTGWTPNTFTYPFGYISNSSFDILKEMRFKATLSCAEGVNQITRDPECLYLLKRYLRSPNQSVEKILSNNK